MALKRETLEFQAEQLDKLVDKLTDHYQELISAIAPYMPVLAHREMDIIKKTSGR